MATIVGDVIGPPAAPPPIKYTSSCTEDQRLSTEGKNVSKHCNISKALEEGWEGSIHPPSLVPRWGYDVFLQTIDAKAYKKTHLETMICHASRYCKIKDLTFAHLLLQVHTDFTRQSNLSFFNVYFFDSIEIT